LIGVALLLAAAAGAQEIDETRCTDSKEAPDLRLGACARLIESGRYRDDRLKLATWHYNRALAHQANRDDEPALVELNRTMELLPDASVAANTRGDLHFKRGRYKEAADDFALSARNDPAWGLPLNNLGLAQTQLQQWDRAIDSFTRALKISANWADAYENRGYVYLQLKRYDEALIDLNQAIALYPSSAFSYRSRGNVLAATGKLADAVKDYDRAIQINDRDPWAFAGRALALIHQRETSRAQKDAEAAEKLAPDNPWLANHICYQLALADKAKEALPHCDRALAIKPDPEIYDSRGFAYLRLKRPAEAVNDYNQTLAKNPRHAMAMFGRCLALQQLKQPREAEVDCTDARALDPSVDEYFARYGLKPR
jgi:tetratricopeptide (TPR) repeat protein